jgi:hypothetical protein
LNKKKYNSATGPAIPLGENLAFIETENESLIRYAYRMPEECPISLFMLCMECGRVFRVNYMKVRFDPKKKNRIRKAMCPFEGCHADLSKFVMPYDFVRETFVDLPEIPVEGANYMWQLQHGRWEVPFNDKKIM